MPIPIAVPIVLNTASTLLSIGANQSAEESANLTANTNAQNILEAAAANASLATTTAAYNSALVTGRAKINSMVAVNNAIIANNNSKLAEQDAQQARESSEFVAGRLRERNRRLGGSQRSGFAKAGIQLKGTASDVMYDSAVQGELDVLIAQHAGKMQERSFMIQAANDRHIANTLNYEAKSLLTFGSAEASAIRHVGDIKATMIRSNAANQATTIRNTGESGDSYFALGAGLELAGNIMTLGSQIPTTPKLEA